MAKEKEDMSLKSKGLLEIKLWFVNIMLAIMWGVIIFLDVFPSIQIHDEAIKIVLFGLTAIIPCYFIYEAIGIWKKFGVIVKDPYAKQNSEEEKKE